MSKRQWGVFAGLLAIAIATVGIAANAQMSEVKEKPPMYSYVGNWAIPRAQWGDMEKADAANQKTLDAALANGTLVGYGHDMNIVHRPEGWTHDEWWSAMSMAGILNILDQFYKSGSATSPVLANAIRHWDGIYVSRYYNWHSGSWKDVYTRVAEYKLKPEAPQDAVETMSKSLFVPLLEKQLADGNIHEYEVDTEAVHTQGTSRFLIIYVAASAEALDKVNAAVQQGMRSNPLGGSAMESMVDFSAHSDELARTSLTYK
jgi:hypothetical protein